MKSFKELGVSEPFLKALDAQGVSRPTEIQLKSIPFLIENGTDFIGQAQTGTGKTLAFGVPILHRVDKEISKPQAIILAPTRELCQQIQKQLFKLTKFYKGVFTEVIVGGENIDAQIYALTRPTQIIVATPGRLLDIIDRGAIELQDVETIILDEADEMISMGFKKDLETILRKSEGYRSVWLFSATFPDNLKELIQKFVSKDVKKEVVEKETIVNKAIAHEFVVCEKERKLQTLIEYVNIHGNDTGIVFCRTKAVTQQLAKQLKAKNFSIVEIHGDLQQRDREKALRIFKTNKAQLLITTDISARGIDVDDVNFVVHYDLPDQIEYYTHRSGRTARAGKKGMSLSIIQGNQVKKIRAIESQLKIKFNRIKQNY